MRARTGLAREHASPSHPTTHKPRRLRPRGGGPGRPPPSVL